jgi:hypothetical protein
MKLPIQAQPVMRKARVTRIYQELTDGIVPSQSDLACCLSYENNREDCFDYWDPSEQRQCITRNFAQYLACIGGSGDNKCVKHWEDGNTVGYTCNYKSACESIRNFWTDRCWGNCDDGKIYCSKDKIGTCLNI